jgi:hypothetical protein
LKGIAKLNVWDRFDNDGKDGMGFLNARKVWEMD